MLSVFQSAGQSVYFPYYNSDTVRVYTLASQCRDFSKAAFIVPKEANSDYKKHYNLIREEQSEELFNLVRYTALQDTVLDPFIQQIFRTILKANPQLPASRLILTRSPVENAFAFGDGTMAFNIGLLAKLQNESQVAFVICHELAHGQLDHVQAGIKSSLALLYSKDIQKEIRQLKKEEFDIHKKVKALVMKMSLNKLYHKRSNEKSADSLAYLMLLKTPYDASEAEDALALLDHIDEPAIKDLIDYPRYFNCSSATYDFSGNTTASSSIFAVTKDPVSDVELSDTLKTHPDCKKRVDYILQLMKAYPAEKKAAQQSRMERIKTVAEYEVIQSWYDYEYYDHALYHALLLLRDEPKNSYLHTMVLLCLYKLNEFMINHEYSEVVSNLSDYHAKNFNDLIVKLNNLKLQDFKQFARCFSERYVSPQEQNEYMLAANFAAAMLNQDQAGAERIKNDYKQHYQGGRFTGLLGLTPQPQKQKNK